MGSSKGLLFPEFAISKSFFRWKEISCRFQNIFTLVYKSDIAEKQTGGRGRREDERQMKRRRERKVIPFGKVTSQVDRKKNEKKFCSKKFSLKLYFILSC